MPLNKDQIKQLGIEEKLLAEKENIERQLKILRDQLDYGNDVDHFDEETDEAEGYANYVGVEQILKHRLLNIEAALEKIKNGTYGLCEKCNQRIPIEILKLNPETQWCSKCKMNARKNR